MILTPTQREAVSHDGNTQVIACPGSGKTRCIVAKLMMSLPKVVDTARRIACITYTNAAVHEIEQRIRQLGRTGDDDYFDICTIHSFCLNNILRYFHWKMPEIASGFEVLPSDSNRYKEYANKIIKQYKLGDGALEALRSLARGVDGTPIVRTPLTPLVAKNFWKMLAQDGWIDFANIVYYSYKILEGTPSIASNLACRYPLILIDEFQDTSSLQVQIMRSIASHGKTQFFLVGDPYQSIYSFAQADPKLMPAFANEIKARSDFHIRENWRSTQKIVDAAQIIYRRAPTMIAVGTNANYKCDVHYFHYDNLYNAITDEFLPLLKEHKISYGKTAIISPSWTKLYPLGRRLREYGVPVVGPGARPYRRSLAFAPLCEEICGFLDRGRPEMIPQIERQLFNTLTEITGRRIFSVFSYEGRKAVYQLIRIGKEQAEKSDSGLEWLTQVSRQISDALIDMGYLAKSYSDILSASAVEMIADMKRNRVDITNLDVQSLGLFACPEHNLKLLTIHASKGREFEAVAMVDLHNGTIPHFSSKTEQEVDEDRRKFYVGTTRAEKLLVYITDTEHPKNKPSLFLKRMPCFTVS